MREIKFRGNNGSEWLYGDVISYKSPALEFTEYWMADDKSDKDNDDIQNWDSVSYVGQYTGLNDKNGNEIYEGDIVKVTTKILNIEKETTGEVNFLDGVWKIDSSYALYDMYGVLKKIEVVGNIYENPELLEVDYEN